MGNVMKIPLPIPKGFSTIISCHGYHALLVLGKDIPLKYVFKHIFLSIVLFTLIIIFFLSIGWLNVSGDHYDLSSNILMLN